MNSDADTLSRKPLDSEELMKDNTKEILYSVRDPVITILEDKQVEVSYAEC